jgi:hypothetical protein
MLTPKEEFSAVHPGLNASTCGGWQVALYALLKKKKGKTNFVRRLVFNDRHEDHHQCCFGQGRITIHSMA